MLKDGRNSPAKSAWPPGEIMTMRDEREIKREREGGKNGEKGEKGGWEERKEGHKFYLETKQPPDN